MTACSIALKNGQMVLVDEDKFVELSAVRWTLGGRGYATHSKRVGFKTTLTYMHRVVIRAKAGTSVDHINGNKLDNRAANLRLATKIQNAQNSGTPKNNKSGLKGAHWCKFAKKWAAQIRVNKKKIALGKYGSLQEAHMAYVRAANKYFGEFSKFKKTEGYDNV